MRCRSTGIDVPGRESQANRRATRRTPGRRNVYFYTLGNMLGVDKIYKWAEKLGMAGKTGIDLPNEQESLIPRTEWKKGRTGEHERSDSNELNRTSCACDQRC